MRDLETPPYKIVNETSERQVFVCGKNGSSPKRHALH